VYCIFMPMHYLGLVGNVRRYSAFVDEYMAPLMPVHRFITIAALLTGAAQFIFLWNLFASRMWGRVAPENPWGATTLEWSVRHDGGAVAVYRGPDAYGVDGDGGVDFVMQNDEVARAGASDE
jgi:cytochrome c oxidase subunit 1